MDDKPGRIDMSAAEGSGCGPGPLPGSPVDHEPPNPTDPLTGVPSKSGTSATARNKMCFDHLWEGRSRTFRLLLTAIAIVFILLIPSFIMSCIAVNKSGSNIIVNGKAMDKAKLTETFESLKSLEDEKNQMKSDLETYLNWQDITDKGVKALTKRMGDLEFRNNNLSKELVQSNNVIKILRQEEEDLRKSLTDVVESDCGGIISIPTTKESYLLQYKLNRNYAPNENCLWTVENTHNTIRSQLTLRVELISYGFKGNTGLFAFKWNRATNLTSEKIPSGKELELSAEGLYLSFTSDKQTSTVGTGFLVRITVIRSDQKSYGSNLFFRTSRGSHTVPSYRDEDQISIALNPKKSIIFDVDKVNSESGNDYLTVYEILAEGKFRDSDRLSGNSQVPFKIPTANPVLTVFTSDASTTGKGFKVSWTDNEN